MKVIEQREMLALTGEEFQTLDKARKLLDNIYAAARAHGEVGRSSSRAIGGINDLLMEDNYIIRED